MPGGSGTGAGGAGGGQLPYNAEAHGQRQQLESFQRGGVVRNEGGRVGAGVGAEAGGSGGPPIPTGPSPTGPLPDVFAPSTTPDVTPAHTGMFRPEATDDPIILLRFLYSINPNPELLRLIQRREGL